MTLVRLEVIPGVGHLSFVEATDDYLARVTGFLKDVVGARRLTEESSPRGYTGRADGS